MLGFGGAFTDSTGLNLNLLSAETRDNALRAYFGPSGCGYTVCRVPIGGSDFSTRAYSLDDVEGDVDLEFWSLAPEDINDKIPAIKRAMELSPDEVLIFGSPWSPPAWMKTNGEFTGDGKLYPEYWQPYANYLVKWVEAYEAEGVPLWGLTPQNEPQNEPVEWGINTCQWPSEDMHSWMKNNLGPSLEQAGYRRLKMMVDDFNRDTLPWYIQPMLEDPDTSKYIDGVAVHWYADGGIGPERLIETHDMDPTKFILYTEACEGWDQPNSESVWLGDWGRAEHYLDNILEDVNHWSVGWVDWNMVLSMTGGPHWPGGAMDAPIIVDPDVDEAYLQPMFYAMAHVAKGLRPGSIRIDSTPVLGELRSTAVVNGDGTIVVVVLNRDESVADVTIAIDDARYLNVQLPAKSFQTYFVPPA